ncbi:MAG TPA: PAS domain S-box protein [Thermoanaerobaculia bacterium]|jgi:PAS domain S-box-containing protein
MTSPHFEFHYDTLPDPLLIHSRGRWVYANSAAQSLLGATGGEELVGRNIVDFIHPADRDRVLPRTAAVAGGTPSGALEQRMLRVDGSVVHVEVSGRPAIAPDGEPAVLVIARDITTRREVYQQLQATFEQAAVGIAHVDRDMRWVRLNERLCEMIGYSREELTGMSPLDVTHPDDVKIGNDGMRRLTAGEIPHFKQEKRYIRKDGCVVWGRLTASVARRDDGSVDYYIAILEDVTEHKRAEIELTKSQERLQHLLHGGNDMVLIVDEHATIRFATDNTARIMGMTPEELFGHQLFALTHPDDIERSVRTIAELVPRPGASAELMVRARHGHDGWRTLAVSMVNRLDDPSIAGIVVKSTDVTERNRLDEELQQMKRVESLGRVAASVAHELNNVLMAVQGAAMMAAKTPGTEALRDALKRALARGKRITSEILRYTQPAMVAKERMPLADFLRDVLHDVEPVLGNLHRAELVLDESLPVVAVDREQMTQVLTNLVLNARDAMRTGGTVLVEARHSPHTERDVIVSVTDHGTGIPPELRERIFEPLFTTKANGTGLGLAIVQQIVLRHGAHLDVESEPGTGTTFSITMQGV